MGERRTKPIQNSRWLALAACVFATTWTLHGRETLPPPLPAPAAPSASGTCTFSAASPLFVPLATSFGGVVIDDACHYVYLTNTSLNRVEVYNLQTQTLEAPIQVGAQPLGLDLTPDGALLYVANNGGSNISVVSVATRLELRKISTPQPPSGTDTPYSLAIGNNGRALFSTTKIGSFGGRLMDLVLSTDQISQRIDNAAGGATGQIRLKASADRGTIAIISGNTSPAEVSKYDAATNAFTAGKRNGDAIDVAIGNSGATLLLATPSSSAGATLVLDSALTLSGKVSVFSEARGIAVHPGSNVGYRSIGTKIEILNLSSFLKIGELPLGDSVSSAGTSNFIGRMDISRDGAALAVITNTGFAIVQPESVGPPQDFNFIRNGRFETGLSNWQTLGAPVGSYVSASVSDGTLEVNRIEAPGVTSLAAVFQQTGRSLPGSAPLEARFSLGNSSSVAKSITVLVGNADLSDTQSCTFTIAPGAALAGYRMRLRSAQPWTDAALYFYADTAGDDGGASRIDNVSLEYDTTLTVNATTCTPPAPLLAPAACDITPPLGNLVALAGTLGEILIDDGCRYVYIANSTMNRIEVFSLSTMSFEEPIQVGAQPFGFDVTPDGAAMYVANAGGQNLSVIDLAQRTEVRKIYVAPHSFSSDTPYSLVVANNGRAIFSTTAGGSGFGARIMQLMLATDQVTARADFGLTTTSTRLHASADRGTIGLAQGGISSGPIYLYRTITDTFSAPKNTNLFLGSVSLNRTGSTVFVMPGSSVYDASLNLQGTIAGGSGGFASAIDPVWPVAYRIVGSNLEVLNLSTFLEGVNLPLGDATNASGRPIGRVDISGDGYLLAVTTNNGFSLVRPPLAAPQNSNLVHNGSFSGGVTGWQFFATPDSGYISASVTSGVLEFNRVAPPPGTANQAVAFQHTGVALPAGTPVQAQFDLGNSSSVRKRISVLLLDADFSDLHVCTFWVPANSALATYRMRSHSTKNWSNAAIYFYAATEGANGGFNRLDNVSVTYDANLPTDRTDCEDPTAPDASVGVDGPDLIGNGDFSGAGFSPWVVFGTLTSQVVGGIFEFVRPTAVLPAGVLLQSTGQSVATEEIVTAGFELGNSSGVRKRVTVLLHDSDFSDLAACTFWLAPNQALSPYTMRAFAADVWTDATISFYAATVDTQQWVQVDNVSLRKTPATTIPGTQCLEIDDLGSAPNTGQGQLAPATAKTTVLGAGRLANSTQGPRRETQPANPPAQVIERLVGQDSTTFTRSEWFDLSNASGGRLSLESLLISTGGYGEIQISTNGSDWTAVLSLLSSDGWTLVDIDLDPWLGQQIAVRFVCRSADIEDVSLWSIRHFRVDVTR